MKLFRIMESKRFTSVPWEKMEPLRESCSHFHSQSLEGLNSRGGLSVKEVWFHITGGGRISRFKEISDDAAEDFLEEWLKDPPDENK